MVIKSLKNNKAAGGPSLTDEIFNLIFMIWHKEKIPIEWRTSVICPIIKKG